MSRGRMIAAAAMTAFALLVLLWGTSEGPGLLGPPRGDSVPGQTMAPVTATFEIDLLPTTAAPQEEELPSINLPWQQIIIALILAVLFSWLLRWLLSRDWEGEEPDLEQEPDQVALLMEATSATSRARALREGNPRNAVVACWVALEDAAERGGLERYAAETSAEFTVRVLQQWEVPTPVVLRLSELYREARFSRHPITEEQRRAAVSALEEIHAALDSAAVPP